LEGSECGLRWNLDRGRHDLSATKSEIRREEGWREEGAFEVGCDSYRVVIV